MQKLNLPEFEVKTRATANQNQIFDSLRKRYVTLTPEEWVRQHFLNLLINHLGYPAGLIAVEHFLRINEVQHRADIVIFNKKGTPFMLIECKSPDITIDKKTILQASIYNIKLKAPYLILTNGVNHYSFMVDHKSGKSKIIKTIPMFQDLIMK